MIIEKILKQLTPERVKREVEIVMKIKLPLNFLKWVKEYNKFGQQNRDEYFWRWLYRTVQTITFPTVEKEYQKSLWNVKLLILMLVTLFDDIADRYKSQNKNLLDELLKIPLEQNYIKFNQLNKEEKEYVKFTIKVWHNIQNTIKKYPRYEEVKDLFEYDVIQLLNAMKYAYLINKNPYLINKTEYWLYLPHNMQALLSLDIDLMCSPKFNFEKLRIFREIASQAQKMARIGNWVSTWEREIKDGDFTSGVWAYALDLDVINMRELKEENELILINKIKDSKTEEFLLKEWEECYGRIYKLRKKIGTTYIQKFLFSLEKLIFYHLSSRGYK